MQPFSVHLWTAYLGKKKRTLNKSFYSQLENYLTISCNLPHILKNFCFAARRCVLGTSEIFCFADCGILSLVSWARMVRFAWFFRCSIGRKLLYLATWWASSVNRLHFAQVVKHSTQIIQEAWTRRVVHKQDAIINY